MLACIEKALKHADRGGDIGAAAHIPLCQERGDLRSFTGASSSTAWATDRAKYRVSTRSPTFSSTRVPFLPSNCKHTEADAIPTHLPDRLEQSADYLPGFAAAPTPQVLRVAYSRLIAHPFPPPSSAAEPSVGLA